MIKYSFIIPVYNRPEEINELLSSFPTQNTASFEVIIVEDGSDITCQSVLQHHKKLPINYKIQSNTGPGLARNKGASLAQGEWLIFLDSDTLISDEYFKALAQLDGSTSIDFFGGPDRNHSSFTPIQKAIGYSMTAFLSTGGIRGRKKSMEKFKPRSFNMGIKKTAFESVEGFSNLRFGEDMDLSLRLEEAGYKGKLLEEAIVFHKRRSTFRQFYKQVFNSGMARIVLTQLHPKSMRLVHLLPLLFLLYHIGLVSITGILPQVGLLLMVYPILFLVTSILSNKSFQVGFLSLLAVYVQLFGYGLGFATASWKRYILGKPIEYAYLDTFYEG